MYSAKFSITGLLLCVSLTQIYLIQGLHLEPTRVKRGIFGTATSIVYKTVEEKVYIPASCIYMDPKLTNYCKHVRFLFPGNNIAGFPKFNFGNEITPTSTVELNTPVTNNISPSGRLDLNQTRTMNVQGWGEYLGFYQPTVTVTSTTIQPTTVRDPWITITYAIKGCKPHNLPTNLEKCPEEDRLELAEIIPTSTVRARIVATKIPEMKNLEIQDALVESTNIETKELSENNRATKRL